MSCSRSGQQRPVGKTSGDEGLSPLAAYQPGDTVPSMLLPGLGFQIPARSEVLSSPPGGSLSKVARSFMHAGCHKLCSAPPTRLPLSGVPVKGREGV